MKYNLRFLIFFLLASSLTGTIHAQTRYVMKTVDIVIPSVLDLAITSGASQVVDFNETGKIDNGIELLSATRLAYKTNQSWYITIQAANANFSGGLSGEPMPASVIGYRINGSGSAYTSLSATAAPLAGSSGAKNPRGKGLIWLDFKIDPGYVNPPAQDYTLQIIYTISNL